MICRYVVWFMITSFLGWIYETVVMTIWEGKWDNRGFLYSPLCPIYGCGVTSVLLLCEITRARGIYIEPLYIFLASMFGSALLELSTSYILELLFHATWWDYSIEPFNFQGRICLFSSIGFGVAGLLIYMYGYDVFLNIIGEPTDTAYTIGALISVAIISADVTATAMSLMSFNFKLVDIKNNLDDRAEVLVSKIMQDKGAKEALFTLVDKYNVVNVSKSLSLLQRRALQRVSNFKIQSPELFERAKAILVSSGVKAEKVKIAVKNRLDKQKKIRYNEDADEIPEIGKDNTTIKER